VLTVYDRLKQLWCVTAVATNPLVPKALMHPTMEEELHCARYQQTLNAKSRVVKKFTGKKSKMKKFVGHIAWKTKPKLSKPLFRVVRIGSTVSPV
jgi:hypothetical protein